jgi:hypothetical protein
VQPVIGRYRVSLEALRRVEVFRSTASDEGAFRTWKMFLSGRRMPVYVDERASGFAELREEVERRGVPVESGSPRHRTVNDLLYCLEAVDLTKPFPPE